MFVYTKQDGSSVATSYGVILLVFLTVNQNETYFNTVESKSIHILTIDTITFFQNFLYVCIFPHHRVFSYFTLFMLGFQH